MKYTENVLRSSASKLRFVCLKKLTEVLHIDLHKRNTSY